MDNNMVNNEKSYNEKNYNEKIYKTVSDLGVAEITEKKSRFIGYVRPVESEEDALEYLNYIKQKHRDARHNVYAYVVRKNNIMRYSDDGEPGGTAGMPVLDIIKKEGLTDIIIVVTRYFGGILLGTGGLVHAYSSAAKAGIEAAKVAEMVLCRKIIVDCDYNMIGKVQYEAAQNPCVIQGEVRYTEKAEADFYVPVDYENSFVNAIKDKTNGSADIIIGDIDYFEDNNQKNK